jgi:hypothetical protein
MAKGGLMIWNTDGEIVGRVASSDSDGLSGLCDKYGQGTFRAP